MTEYRIFGAGASRAGGHDIEVRLGVGVRSKYVGIPLTEERALDLASDLIKAVRVARKHPEAVSQVAHKEGETA